MKTSTVVIDSQDLTPLVGQIVCHDVARRFGRGTLFHKGHCLTEADLPAVAGLRGLELHLLELAADDLHEDLAGLRLAEAIAGPGVHLSEQKQSRIHLLADHHGLLTIDTEGVTALNEIEAVCVYTIYSDLVVAPDEAVCRYSIYGEIV